MHPHTVTQSNLTRKYPLSGSREQSDWVRNLQLNG